MNYDFSTAHQIRIRGKSVEIKKWLKELCDVFDKGASYSQIQDEVNNLENIVEPVQYTFGVYHRIYFNRDSILYVPNVSGDDAKKFHFEVFKKLFDKAKNNFEKNY
ncbi:MAG: hypothetical protein KJ583_06615 [Nanoarchaeota archaeon]|nr:hypothetical protein [Nanoarchaeota archaeon]MBU1269063.1 hypothetical protein [Nanoarchaeota archaeon]MBU1604958.1 hypothetical protein [Nanoarchaeota archaeon]MBU2443312.1 hypothetical protein [Nanoarchaeota archaeon]